VTRAAPGLERARVRLPVRDERGGYWNTGWDLISNFIGATAAGLVIARSRAGAA
jgi:hypothetical protein